LPAHRPDTFIIGTNFGLITSLDGGATWQWICEHGEGDFGSLYQHTAAPGARVFALAGDGRVIFTDDLACTWKVLSDGNIRLHDYFLDPGNPSLAFLIGTTAGGGSVILESTGDSAAPRTLFATPGDQILSVEVAASDPRIMYATVAQYGAAKRVHVLRSDDAGAKWTALDPGESVGKDNLWIAAVDPEDALKLYMRVIGVDGERLAVSDDGGKTVSFPLSGPGSMSAFVRLANKAILVGALDGLWGGYYTSNDGGKTFSPPNLAIRPRAFAERAGKVYAATDNALDGFALAESGDGGATWRRLMSFEDVHAIAYCPGALTVCTDACLTLVSQVVFRQSTCHAAVDAAARPDAPSSPDAADASAGDSASPGKSGNGGCACELGPHRGAPGGALPLLTVIAVAWGRGRFSRRRVPARGASIRLFGLRRGGRRRA
jgi:photosystem II stability/assembly factor-like uncharacterized protein